MIHNLPQYTANKPAYVQYAGETGNTAKGTVIVTILNQDGVAITSPRTYTGEIGSNIGDITPNISEGYKVKEITDNNNIITKLPTKFSNVVQNITYHVVEEKSQVRYTIYINGKAILSDSVEGQVGTKANYSVPGVNAPVKLTKILFNGVEVKNPSVDYRPDFGHSNEKVQYYYVSKSTPEVKPTTGDNKTKAEVKPAGKNTETKPADKKEVKPTGKNTETKPADKKETKSEVKKVEVKSVDKKNEVKSTDKNDSNKTTKTVAHKESSVKELPHTGLGKSQDNAAKDAGILATIMSAILALGVFRKRK